MIGGSAALKTVYQSVRRFLTAEEVPRWFGLSIVLIYLVGLGTVANVGILYARNESSMQFQHSSRNALQQLADQLALMGYPESDNPAIVNQYQKALHRFSTQFLSRIIRVANDKKIIASSVSTEIGVLRSKEDSAISGPDSDQIRYSSDWWIRLAVPFHRLAKNTVVDENSKNTTTKSNAPVYLEANFPPTPPAISSLSSTAGTLSIVLAVLGSLFMVYRCLREQLRGMSRIVDRLHTHRHRIENELGSLRIANTVGFDQIIASWNELVDLTQRLQEKVEHTEATEELTRALQNVGNNSLAEALHAVPDGMIFITDENRFEYANSAACRIFGWEIDQVKNITLDTASATGIGLKILNIILSSRQSDGSFKPYNELMHVDDAESKFQGSYRIMIIPMHRAHREGECLVIIRDVSQQIRAERAREEFVSHVSHELRTPLTNIRAYSETLSSGMFEDPKVMTECYNVITKETRRLSRLIEDILNVSQLEVGTIEITLDRVDLNTLLSECIRDIQGLADEKNINLKLILPPKLDEIQADRDKLSVVINNLLGNSIKYTPKDGTIIVGCQSTRDEVVLTFKDNGIGIDPNDHGRIFEKFQRGNEPEVQNETGSGIGLFTAREIIRRHGGDIELISNKNEGATFMVKLPHQESRAASKSTSEEN